METIDIKTLKELIATDRNLCISIYIPTVKMSKEVRQNSIRYKNALTKVEDMLGKMGYRKKSLDDILESPRKLIKNDAFWNRQDKGLALFISNEDFNYYQLPFAVNETVLIDESFYIVPMLRLYSGNKAFYILTLDPNYPRLLKADKFGYEDLTEEKSLKNIKEVLQFEDPEKELQFFTGSKPRTGKGRDALFFGTGDADLDEKKLLLEYFNELDRNVAEYLKEKPLPLILAGVEFAVPIYREANSYSDLRNESIDLSPEGLSDDQIHEKSVELMKEYFKDDLNTAISEFAALKDGDNKASGNLEIILPAAINGIVKDLIISTDRKIWGRYDPRADSTEIHEKQEPGNYELLNASASNTILKGGKVHLAEKDEMPEGKEYAAVFRY